MLRKRNASSILRTSLTISLVCLWGGLQQGLHAAPHRDHGLNVAVSSVHRTQVYRVHGGPYRPHVFHRHHRHHHVYHHYHPHRHGYGVALGLGVLGGGLIGAAIAQSAPPVVVNPAPVIYTQPAVVVSSMQPQGLVADPALSVNPPYGTIYSALPAGCNLEQVLGQNYYRCGSYWYQPQFGSQGVQYLYVAPPQ